MKLGYIGIDQYGQYYPLKTAHPRKELMERIGTSHADKMYVDTKDGATKHIGYIMGRFWIAVYEIHEWAS